MLLILSIFAVVIGLVLLSVFIIDSKNFSEQEVDIEKSVDEIKQLVIQETVLESSVSEEETSEQTEAELTDTEAVTESAEVVDEVTDTEPRTEIETETARPQEEYSLDIASLKSVNPDIYAWIEIEGTKVDYPILQSKDDSKYLSTGYDGKPYIGGAIFTESAYNSKSFDDPVTIIYGHTMKAGTLFGSLQSVYSDKKTFESCDEIKIFLDNEVRRYKVFAAVPYDTKHILYTYDFSNDYWYRNFFKSIKKIRSIGANFNEERFPEAGEKVIILSTCLTGDNTQRYLVMAVLDD